MNVIWIISDTFRKDHLGCYGNKSIHTPSLDAFSEKSVRFDRHYAHSFPTMPARADFYSGRWTSCFMRWEPLPREIIPDTFPSIAGRAGFHTAAIVDTPFYIRLGFNYDVGFRTFEYISGQGYWIQAPDDVRARWRTESDRFAPRTFTAAMNWLERHYKEDFLLYIDAWDPHEPWDAPNYYTEMYMPDYDGEKIHAAYARWQDVEGLTRETVDKAHACYCGECTMVDAWAGRLLRQVEDMGLMDNTAIIFTTDHGFYFGEHDGLFGKLTRAFPGPVPYYNETDPSRMGWLRSPLFEEIIDIPLMLYVPGVKPGVYNGLTSAVDLMPTVLDIMGLDKPDVVEGQSLLPVMKDTSEKGRDFVISTHPFANSGVIIRSVDGIERTTVGSDTTITTDEWSLLYFPEPGETSLYHLPSDPGQEKDVINEKPEVARELHQMLVKFMTDNNLAPEMREPRLELKL